MIKFFYVFILLNLSFCLHTRVSSLSAIERVESTGFPKITNYPGKKYAGNPQNYDVVQDNAGVMYFGNMWGILQFDGSVWNKIYLPNAASCTSMAKDDKGVIYVGGRNEIGYLKSDSIGRKTYVSLCNLIPKEGKAFNEVWGTFVTNEGVLFVSYEVLLFKLKDKDEIKILTKNITNAFYVANNIWVVKNNELFVFKNNTFQKAEDSQLFSMNSVKAIQTVNEKLLFASDEGIFALDGKLFKPWNLEFNRRFKSSKINKILKTHDNKIILTTQFNGLIITDVEGNTLYHLTKSNGLLANTISGSFLDNKDNLWIASSSGISYVSLSDPFSYINEMSGISGVPYSSAIYNGNLYLSTSEGLYRKSLLHSSQIFEKVKEVTGLIWCLYVFDNKLFCGHESKAYQIEGSNISQIFNEGTWLFYPFEDGRLILMGTYKGLVVLEKKNNKWQLRNKIQGFSESSRFVISDKYGDIWVSHGNKGVYQIRLDNSLTRVAKLKFFNKKDGLPEDFDNTIYKINNEILITGFRGVYKFDYDAEQIKPYFMLEDVLGRGAHIERLVQYSNDQIWAVFNSGSLVRIKVIEDSRCAILWETQRNRNNWVPSFEHLNPVSDSVLIIGTQEGFSLIKLSDTLNYKKEYACYITKIEVQNPRNEIVWNGYESGSFLLTPNLKYLKGSIRFDFVATSYEDIQNLRYQQCLEGLGDDIGWSEWSNVSFKEYTNLKEGDYIFRVRAINSDDILSAENKVSFTILPPWYRTILAYIIYALIVLAVMFFTIQWLQKWMAKEKTKMEENKRREMMKQELEWKQTSLVKEQALVKLQKEKLEAEALALRNKELLIEQQKEREMEMLEMQQQKLEADLNSKNQELTSLTLHIVHKNETLSQIKGTITKAILETKDLRTKSSLTSVEKLIETNLNSDKEWEQFTEHFDIVHEGFLKKLQEKYPDLKTSSLKLCAYIKMKLSSKQIAVLMNTEPESVNKARYRLRQRFELDKDVSLEEFLSGLKS